MTTPRTSIGAPLRIFIAHPSRLLTDHLPNGDGLIAFGFIRELAARGHELHIAVDEVDLCEPLPANARLYRIPRRFAGGPLRRLEYMLGVRLLLGRLQRSLHFDVVHQLNPVFTGLSLALIGMRQPLVLGTYVAAWPTAPATGLRRLFGIAKSIIKRTIARAQQDRAAALLVTTEAALRDRIVAASRHRSKVFAQKHGVDIERFRPPSDRTRSHDAQTILFVASLARKKGIYVLLDAFREVRARCPSARLVVAGGGTELAKVTQRAEQLGLTSSIDFLGSVERSAIADLMRASSVFCLPSYGEPYATSVIEALASGLPIVVTDSGGVAEIIDENGGRRVRTGSSSELSAALTEILYEPEVALQMSKHNRLRAEHEFAWPRVVDTLESVYRTVTRPRP